MSVLDQGSIHERCDLKRSLDEVIQLHLARYQFVADFVQEKTVLDIACGTGYGSELLAQHKAKKVIGVDLSKETILENQKKYVRDNLIFQTGNAERLNFPDNSFDVVVSLETIEHLKKRDQFLSEIARILRPIGLLILSTPNKEATLRSKFWPKPLNPYHLIEYKKGQLERLVKKHFNQIEWFGQKRIPKKNLSYLIERVFNRLFKNISPNNPSNPQIIFFPKESNQDVCIFVLKVRLPKK